MKASAARCAILAWMVLLLATGQFCRQGSC